MGHQMTREGIYIIIIIDIIINIIRDKAVLLLCCISKFKQLSFFSNFVRSKAEPVFATSILADQNNEINLYHQSKGINICPILI